MGHIQQWFLPLELKNEAQDPHCEMGEKLESIRTAKNKCVQL